MSAVQNFISKIYDCAANPELWPDTLVAIRDHMNAAYVMVGFTDLEPLRWGKPLRQTAKHSPWNTQQIMELGQHLQSMPGYDTLVRAEVDQAWVQMWECDEAEFKKSSFAKNCVEPYGLRDASNVPFIRRPTTAGVLTAVSYASRELFGKNRNAKPGRHGGTHSRTCLDGSTRHTPFPSTITGISKEFAISRTTRARSPKHSPDWPQAKARQAH
jgi:hypothetical protein